MASSGEKPARRNLMIGKWIPQDKHAVLAWAKRQLEKFKITHSQKYAEMMALFPDTHTVDEEVQQFARNASKLAGGAPATLLLPPVMALAQAMATEPDVAMVMCQMFNSDSEMNARDFLFTLNYTIRTAPKFVDEDSGIQIPVPVGCLLTYAMATPGGFAAFIKNRINELFKDILDDYGQYLTKRASCYVLTDDLEGGWFTAEALSEMPDFAETFVCDPEAEYWGYNSFDDFFTRKLIEGPEGRRPTASPDNDLVVVNACENAPYQVAYSVQRHDAFWVKSQPYSLQYILDGEDEYLEKFVGGTIYQGFLSPHTYHRFHAPVSGEVKVAKVVPGTYFSQPYYSDSEANYIASQPYLAHMATRGVIIIDTKNPNIGCVGFVPIGMVDVSTVDLSPLDQSTTGVVTKGDNIGCFHFGGSSHLLIFEKGVELAFDLQGIVPDPNGNEFLNVRSKIATVVPKVVPN